MVESFEIPRLDYFRITSWKANLSDDVNKIVITNRKRVDPKDFHIIFLVNNNMINTRFEIFRDSSRFIDQLKQFGNCSANRRVDAYGPLEVHTRCHNSDHLLCKFLIFTIGQFKIFFEFVKEIIWHIWRSITSCN